MLALLTEWIASNATINVTTVITFFLCLAILFRIFNPSKNLPPGPINLPIVGYMPFMIGKRVENVFAELKEKYGDIVSLQVGAKQMVILNSYETIKEALVSNPDTATTRPEGFSAFNEMFSNQGHIVENGNIWRDQRRFLMKTLRDLGMGKDYLETQIREEAIVLMEEIRKNCGQHFDVYQLFVNAAANIMSSLLNGYRFKYCDPAFHDLLYMSITLPNRVYPFKIINAFPYIRYFLPPFLSGMKEVNDAKNSINTFFKRKIQDHKISDGEIFDYTNLYLKQKMQDLENGKTNSLYTDSRLQSNIFLLNAAGIVTTSGTLYWAVKMVIRHPEKQKKLQEEIDQVIGSQRIPCYSDKPNMPYTDAFLMETQRYGDVIPLGVPRSTKVETQIAGYDIPIGTTIMPLLTIVNYDPKIWGDPEVFRPERFIGEDGKARKSEYLIPFSIGKRSCPGETLAVMEMFCFFASLLQNFIIKPATAEDAQFVVPEIIGFAKDVAPFKVIFEKRH